MYFVGILHVVKALISKLQDFGYFEFFTRVKLLLVVSQAILTLLMFDLCFPAAGGSVGTQIDSVIDIGSYARKWSDVSISSELCKYIIMVGKLLRAFNSEKEILCCLFGHMGL